MNPLLLSLECFLFIIFQSWISISNKKSLSSNRSLRMKEREIKKSGEKLFPLKSCLLFFFLSYSWLFPCLIAGCTKIAKGLANNSLIHIYIYIYRCIRIRGLTPVYMLEFAQCLLSEKNQFENEFFLRLWKILRYYKTPFSRPDFCFWFSSKILF